jgi:hypothetical protein
MTSRVALLRKNIREGNIASIIRAERIGDLEKSAITSNSSTVRGTIDYIKKKQYNRILPFTHS